MTWLFWAHLDLWHHNDQWMRMQILECLVEGWASAQEKIWTLWLDASGNVGCDGEALERFEWRSHSLWSPWVVIVLPSLYKHKKYYNRWDVVAVAMENGGNWPFKESVDCNALTGLSWLSCWPLSESFAGRSWSLYVKSSNYMSPPLPKETTQSLPKPTTKMLYWIL